MSEKKKILIITYKSPYPATDGGKISIYGTVNYLRSYYDITLAYPCTVAEKKDVEDLKKIWTDVHVLAFFRDDHNKGRISLVNSARQLLAYLQRFKKKDQTNTAQRVWIDATPFQPLDEAYINFIKNIIDSHKFDIIQVEHTPYLSLITLLPADATRIFVQIENRYSIVEDTYAVHHISNTYSQYNIDYCRTIETGMMDRYDRVFALNEMDKVSLAKYMDDKKICYAPFPVLDSFMADDNKPVPDGNITKLVFMGSEDHYPNKDAVVWFAEKMLPHLKNYQLYVTGNWSEPFIKQHQDIIFTGFVDNINEVLNGSIMICPVRLGGGGIRAKVIQAMAMKVPVVSTSMGCFGIKGKENNHNILVSDDEMEFVKAINELATDTSLRKKIIANGFELIQHNYTEKAVGDIRRKIYDSLV